jgi:protein-disulfide isomerase
LRFTRLVLCGILTLSSMAAAQSSSKSMAVVNGETITEDDLARVADGRIRQLTQSRLPGQSDPSLEREKLSIRWDALHYLIERRLARVEAARLMISEDELIQNEVESKVAVPTIEMARAFLEANKVRMPMIGNVSPAEAISQIRGYLSEQDYRAIRLAYFEKLSRQYQVKTFLEPLRVPVASNGFPTLGIPAAPVTIVEFSDFECPECATLTQALRTIQQTNGAKVRIVYRQLPLAHLHPAAMKAAEASLCAHDQDHFWEFHDSLFERQKELAPTELKSRAAALKLDGDVFNACLDSGKHTGNVNRDIDEAYSAGVRTTPTIFINGRMMSGNRAASEILEIVDEELRKVAAIR